MDDHGRAVAPDRAWLDLEGAHNVRDLGGLPAGNARTRSRVLLRGDALDALTTADVRVLVDEVGLVQVIDLRTMAERAERSEDRLAAAGVEVVELEAFDGDDMARRRRTRLARLASGVDPVEIMVEAYLEMADIGGRVFAQVLDRLVAKGGTPALVHCTAGKDRTGVLVALLLEVAGVDREAVIADYAATGERMAPIVERIRGAAAFQQLAEDIPAFVLDARSETMVSFLDQLDARFGTAAEFWRQQGTTDETLSTWRRLIAWRNP